MAIVETQGNEYEFDPHDGEHFRDLGSAMRFAGTGAVIVALIAGGLVGVVAMRVSGTTRMVAIGAGVAEVLLMIFIGMLHVSTASHVAQVHTTEGRDITHLMNGLARLRGLYRMLAVLLVLLTIAGIGLPTLVLLMRAGIVSV